MTSNGFEPVTRRDFVDATVLSKIQKVFWKQKNVTGTGFEPVTRRDFVDATVLAKTHWLESSTCQIFLFPKNY